MNKKIETGSNFGTKKRTQQDLNKLTSEENRPDSNAGKIRKKKASKDKTENSGSDARDRSNITSENSRTSAPTGSRDPV